MCGLQVPALPTSRGLQQGVYRQSGLVMGREQCVRYDTCFAVPGGCHDGTCICGVLGYARPLLICPCNKKVQIVDLSLKLSPPQRFDMIRIMHLGGSAWIR